MHFVFVNFSNTSSTDLVVLVQLSVNYYFTLHSLLVNHEVLYIDKLSLIWASIMYCVLSRNF